MEAELEEKESNLPEDDNDTCFVTLPEVHEMLNLKIRQMLVLDRSAMDAYMAASARDSSIEANAHDAQRNSDEDAREAYMAFLLSPQGFMVRTANCSDTQKRGKLCLP